MFGSNIMSLFSGGNAQQPAQPAPPAPTGVNNPGQPLPGTQASSQTAPNGAVPSQQQDPNAGGAPGKSDASPLADFKDIWQTPVTDPNAAPAGLFANLDPAKVMESAKRVNFSGQITPEQLQAIASGGEAAVKAFQESMNQVAQSVYAQSALATTKIVEQALSKSQEQYDARLPSMVKKFSANEGLMTANPMLSNPAIQPLVGALQEQLIRKNPGATSAEIQQQVSDYFNALGTTFAPKPAATQGQQPKRQEQDWSDFLGGN